MSEEKAQIQILIVDDHAVVRRGLTMVLVLQPDLAVVGETGTASSGVRMAGALHPDVILLDLTLPDQDGDAAVAGLRAASPESRILILSGVQDTGRIRAAIAAGIDGYVPKEVNPGELARAIRQVAANQSYIHPDILHQLSCTSQPPAMPPAALTPRELEVLQLMATTATNREIAEQLVVGEETIRSHVKSILRKLNKANRTQAVLEGIRCKLIEV